MNKSKYILWLAILGVAFSFAACARNKKYQAQAETQFKQGNYETAAFYAIESLKLKPDFRKAQITLKESYTPAIIERSERILQLQERSDEERWEALLVEYLALEKLNNAVLSLPPLTDPETGQRVKLDTRDYSPQLSEARQNCAANYYQQGMHQSRMDSSKAGQRIAAEYFKKSMSYVPNYLDSAGRYESARQKAVTRIAILPFEDKSASGTKYGAVSDILMDQIIAYLLQASENMEYTELITRDRIDQLMQEQELSASGLVEESSAASIGHLLGAHTILSGKILQINLNSPKIARHRLSETASITDKDSDEDIEIQISCRFTKYTMNSSLQILASYSLVDVATGKIEAHQNFNPQYKFEQSWARIEEGDERALNSEQLAWVEKPEAVAPSAVEMVNTVLEELGEQIVEHLAYSLK